MPVEPKILLKTCHVNIQSSINIFVLFESIKLDTTLSDEHGTLTIRGTRFHDKARGDINEVKNNQHKKRKDFSNQCSVTGDLTTNNIVTKVNFKVFNNGNIIITGMKSDNETIKNALRLFLKIIVNLTYTFDEHPDNPKEEFLKLFDNSYEKYSKFIYNHHAQILKLMNITETIDLGIFDVFNNSVIVDTLDIFITPKWNDKIYYFIKLFDICYCYSSKDFIENVENNVIKQIITSTGPKVFPLSFNMTYNDIDNIINKVDVVIENINAIVKFDFILDRSKFYNYVLENALNKDDVSNPDFVDFISFEQSMYQGINIKYKVGCVKNKPKYITFLIFQEGKILISGTRNEKQLQEYAEKILKLINQHREIYEIKKPLLDSISTQIQNYPSFTADINYPLTNQHVKIIHYTKLIELNPRNYYILKHIHL